MQVRLKNEIGDRNSHINVCIHLLVNIPEIKDYIVLSDFPFVFKYNLFNQIKLIFEKYLKNKMVIDVEEIKNEFQFMFGKDTVINDPIDVMFIIINAIHNSYVDSEDFTQVNEEQCTSDCLAHSLFYINLAEQDKLGDLYKYANHNYFYEMQVKYDENNFSYDSIQTSLFKEHKRTNASNGIKRIMLTSPKYFMVPITFEGGCKLFDICVALFMIPPMICNDDIFTIYDKKVVKTYSIKGLVVKSAEENYAIVLSLGEGKFIYYEDMVVIPVQNWKNVIELILEKERCPVLAIYGELVDVGKLPTEDDFLRCYQFCVSVEKGSIKYLNDEKDKLRNVKTTKMDVKNVNEILEVMKQKANERKMLGDDVNELFEMIDHVERRKESIEENIDSNAPRWECQNCSYGNKDQNRYRCKRCNFFNYAQYKKISKKQKEPEEDNKEKESTQGCFENVINFDTSSISIDGMKCWQCGHFNKWYKLKCGYCRFDINFPVDRIFYEEKVLRKPAPKPKQKNSILINDVRTDFKYRNTSSVWRCKCGKENVNTLYCIKCYLNKPIN